MREVALDFEAAIERAAADPAVPGAIAAVRAPRLGIDWSGATEHRLVDGSASRSPDTPFRLASTTKMFVAAAVMRLVEADRLDLRQPVAPLVSAAVADLLREGGLDPGRITVAQLMSHTSGLRDHVAQQTYVDAVLGAPERVWTREEQVAIAARAGPPLGEPGGWFQYSDTGYVILGEIIERATGSTLGSAVRELVGFERLGATSTWWESQEPAPAGARPRAAQFVHEAEVGRHHPSFDLHGGGGLVSTVGDLVRLTRALVMGEPFRREGTLAAAYLITPAVRSPEAPFVHSQAFMLLPVGDRFGWGHAGFWGCAGVCVPELDVTIAATINQARPAREGALGRLLGDLLAAVRIAAG